jgi:hypothetical protein
MRPKNYNKKEKAMSYPETVIKVLNILDTKIKMNPNLKESAQSYFRLTEENLKVHPDDKDSFQYNFIIKNRYDSYIGYSEGLRRWGKVKDDEFQIIPSPFTNDMIANIIYKQILRFDKMEKSAKWSGCHIISPEFINYIRAKECVDPAATEVTVEFVSKYIVAIDFKDTCEIGYHSVRAHINTGEILRSR